MSTVGGSMAIYAAIRAFVGRGDNAVIVSPAYAIFSNGVIMAGGEPRPASLARDGRRFRLDLDRVARGDRSQHPDADRQQPVESDRLDDHASKNSAPSRSWPSATTSSSWRTKSTSG